MGKLVLRLPDGSTREFQLERERLTIGRRADNDICLPFPAVSSEHAAVVTILDDSFLEDLHSTNGTLVNGKSITKHFLRDRDEIDIGRHTFMYVSGEFTTPSQASMQAPMMPTIAVTENGGATIGDDEATVVPAPRERRAAASTDEAPATVPAHASAGPEPESWPHQPTRLSIDVVAPDDAPADAPTLEVLDGPSAGCVAQIGRGDFVIGRVGVQIAVVQRRHDGYRLMPLEGALPPRVNGAALSNEGRLLAVGDEIEIAGTKLIYRPAT